MYATQLPFVELYRAVMESLGGDVYTEVLEPWIQRNEDQRRWIEEFQRRTNDDWHAATDEDQCRLYAMFRITSILLLRFQSGRADGTDYPGPGIGVEGFQLFHEALGFQVPNVAAYHPFFHEILSVDPAPRDDDPIRITGQLWPCLMLGDLLFCRAGCSVSGGSSHVVKDVAESSTLYWTYRRKDRRYNDQSHGWGSNSQWRTAHRRDYLAQGRYHFNVDGKWSLNDPQCDVDETAFDAMIELVRHRCFIRSRLPHSDLYPYLYRWQEEA